MKKFITREIAKGWMTKALALFLCCVLMTSLSVSITGCTSHNVPDSFVPTVSTNETENYTVESTGAISNEGIIKPTTEPTSEPPKEPTEEPTGEPTEEPTEEPSEDDPVWKYNHPNLTEVYEYRYAHSLPITVYDSIAVCSQIIGSQIFFCTYGNAIGQIGFNEGVICTGVYDNGWLRIEYDGKTAYAESRNGNPYKLYAEPILFTYTDGTTGTEPKDGATYIDNFGSKRTYEVAEDSYGRKAGETCAVCSKMVSANGVFNEGDEPVKYCHYSSCGTYCNYCGKNVPAGTCHDCIEHFGGLQYCIYCGKVKGDGTNDTCVKCYAADYLGYTAGDTTTAGGHILEYLGNGEWKDEDGTIWYSYEKNGKLRFYRLSVNGSSSANSDT